MADNIDPKTQLKALKKEIKADKETLLLHDEELRRLCDKKAEFQGKLTNIGTKITKAESDCTAAVSRYARGEITESELDGLQENLAQLQRKKLNITGALDVVEKDESAIVDKKNELRKTLKEKERRAWSCIYKIEIQNIAGPIGRAYVALDKASPSVFGARTDSSSIIRSAAELNKFASEDNVRKIADEMYKEYLG
jgi:predicted  nucleic acid-binding Zn-ribbon protein